jgi:hypothetical protein
MRDICLNRQAAKPSIAQRYANRKGAKAQRLFWLNKDFLCAFAVQSCPACRLGGKLAHA